MLVYDLQFRLRCAQCSRVKGAEISLLDERNRNDISVPPVLRVIVPGGE